MPWEQIAMVPRSARPKYELLRARWQQRNQRGAIGLSELAGIVGAAGVTIALWPGAQGLRERIQSAGRPSPRRRVGAASPIIATAVIAGTVGVAAQDIAEAFRDQPLPAVSLTTAPIASGGAPTRTIVVGDSSDDEAVAVFPAPNGASAVEFVTHEYRDGSRCADLSVRSDTERIGPLGSVNLSRDRTRVIDTLPAGERCEDGGEPLVVQIQELAR